MRIKTAVFLAVAGLAGAVAPSSFADESSTPQNQAPKGFNLLFNGKDMTGWHGMPHFDPRKFAELGLYDQAKKIVEWTDEAKKHWTVEDGQLVNDGHGAYLTTDKDYGDIELLIDYKTVPKGDSGIYLRATPQVQIWDSTKEGGKWNLGADKGSGGLWNNSPGAPGKDPLVLADKTFEWNQLWKLQLGPWRLGCSVSYAGEWNHLRIVQVGARTTVYLNDKLVVDHAIMENYWDRAAPLLARSVIQLQTHGAEIRWRNVFVREIPVDEANKILAQHGAEGFTSLFDGKTLDHWSGATEHYEVVDGAIRCKPHQGGVLYFDKEYSNFVARVAFKLPPGGNNGLAIRYPGQGDTAYSGMCELQVLDDGNSRYAGKIDPRQAHGSAYGMVAAKRGFLRPVGEWNFEEVTVKGSTIKVELNGSVILDTDLSKVTDYMAKSAHPGKDRTQGYFGFAGHGDPVEFRAISIKPLD